MNGAARICGLGAVLGNVLGVVFLRGVPSPYRPGDVSAWLTGLHAHPGPALLSAWSFTLGLVLLAAFMVLLAVAARPARRGLFLAGVAIVAAGALLNAAGTLAPAAAVRLLPPPPDPVGEAVGRALLGLTLHLDAHFNLVLGAGLLAVNLGLGRESGVPGWLRALGLAAGLASLPVALQWWRDGFALLLSVSGPLWLAWFAALAVRGVTPAASRAPASA